MTFSELPEFQRDLKKLLKKYRSLNQDLEIIKKVLKVEPEARPPISYRIEGLGIESHIIKMRRIACKSLKGKGANSGLRLIYAYFKSDSQIIFTEIYHKNDKPNEDRARIKRNFK